MTQSKYHSMYELVSMIDEPNRSKIMELIRVNLPTLLASYGSVHNHQAWPGGWWDHTVAVMNRAVLWYPDPRPHTFSLSDALLVLFFHDIEKPWKYKHDDDGRLVHRHGMVTKAGHQRFRMGIIRDFEIELTPEHENGIMYAEGELEGYSNRKRISGELAGFAHCCDHYVARVQHQYPLANNDPWKGAHRIASDDGTDHAEYLARFEANVDQMVADMLEAGKTY